MSTHIAVRLPDDDLDMLDRYMARHHLENRSQAIRHAVRLACNMEEGESVSIHYARPKAKGLSVHNIGGDPDDRREPDEVEDQDQDPMEHHRKLAQKQAGR